MNKEQIPVLDREKYPVIIIGQGNSIYVDSKNVFAKFDGNTNQGGDVKLKSGTYYAHCLGIFNNEYVAVVQHKGEVDVVTKKYVVGEKPVSESTSSEFAGINIQKGSTTIVPKNGSQTINGDQWFAFIQLVKCEMIRSFDVYQYDKEIIPYVLLEDDEEEIV